MQQGTNFGFADSDIDLRLGGVPCDVTVEAAHTRLSFEAPPGVGAGLPLSLAVGGQAAALPGTQSTFSYDAPSVAGFEPAHGPTAGGAPLLVSGENFGSSAAAVLPAEICPAWSKCAIKLHSV